PRWYIRRRIPRAPPVERRAARQERRSFSADELARQRGEGAAAAAPRKPITPEKRFQYSNNFACMADHNNEPFAGAHTFGLSAFFLYTRYVPKPRRPTEPAP